MNRVPCRIESRKLWHLSQHHWIEGYPSIRSVVKKTMLFLVHIYSPTYSLLFCEFSQLPHSAPCFGNQTFASLFTLALEFPWLWRSQWQEMLYLASAFKPPEGAKLDVALFKTRPAQHFPREAEALCCRQQDMKRFLCKLSFLKTAAWCSAQQYTGCSGRRICWSLPSVLCSDPGAVQGILRRVQTHQLTRLLNQLTDINLQALPCLAIGTSLCCCCNSKFWVEDVFWTHIHLCENSTNKRGCCAESPWSWHTHPAFHDGEDRTTWCLHLASAGKETCQAPGPIPQAHYCAL